MAPKRMGGAPSPGMSTVSAAASVPSATAASSDGTPVNSVSVVSAGETVESTESAPGECLHERASITTPYQSTEFHISFLV